MKFLRRTALTMLGIFGFAAAAEAQAQQKEEPAKPHSVWVTPYCGVHHFNPNWRYKGVLPLNEDPDCYGARVDWKVSKNWHAGVMGLDFTNSIYKRTTIAGIFAERALVGNIDKGASCGIGAAAAVQVRVGYKNAPPVLPEVYGFCKAGPLKANVLLVPPVAKDVSSAVIWSAEIKIFRF